MKTTEHIRTVSKSKSKSKSRSFKPPPPKKQKSGSERSGSNNSVTKNSNTRPKTPKTPFSHASTSSDDDDEDQLILLGYTPKQKPENIIKHSQVVSTTYPTIEDDTLKIMDELSDTTETYSGSSSDDSSSSEVNIKANTNDNHNSNQNNAGIIIVPNKPLGLKLVVPSNTTTSSNVTVPQGPLSMKKALSGSYDKYSNELNNLSLNIPEDNENDIMDIATIQQQLKDTNSSVRIRRNSDGLTPLQSNNREVYMTKFKMKLMDIDPLSDDQSVVSNEHSKSRSKSKTKGFKKRAYTNVKKINTNNNNNNYGNTGHQNNSSESRTPKSKDKIGIFGRLMKKLVTPRVNDNNKIIEDMDTYPDTSPEAVSPELLPKKFDFKHVPTNSVDFHNKKKNKYNDQNAPSTTRARILNKLKGGRNHDFFDNDVIDVKNALAKSQLNLSRQETLENKKKDKKKKLPIFYNDEHLLSQCDVVELLLNFKNNEWNFNDDNDIIQIYRAQCSSCKYENFCAKLSELLFPTVLSSLTLPSKSLKHNYKVIIKYDVNKFQEFAKTKTHIEHEEKISETPSTSQTYFVDPNNKFSLINNDHDISEYTKLKSSHDPNFLQKYECTDIEFDQNTTTQQAIKLALGKIKKDQNMRLEFHVLSLANFMLKNM